MKQSCKDSLLRFKTHTKWCRKTFKTKKKYTVLDSTGAICCLLSSALNSSERFFLNIMILLSTADNWKWKGKLLLSHCHVIYREEAVKLKTNNYTLKHTILANMRNSMCKKIQLYEFYRQKQKRVLLRSSHCLVCVFCIKLSLHLLSFKVRAYKWL